MLRGYLTPEPSSHNSPLIQFALLCISAHKLRIYHAGASLWGLMARAHVESDVAVETGLQDVDQHQAAVAIRSPAAYAVMGP